MSRKPKHKPKAFSSATSRPIIPTVFRAVPWQKGSRNGDIGGGKYIYTTDFLRSKGVENIVWDPGHPSGPHNGLERLANRGDYGRVPFGPGYLAWAASLIEDHQCDTVTVANVLNVLPYKTTRLWVVDYAAAALKPGGTAYFQIYEGGDGRERSGVRHRSRDGWQLNRATVEYLPEIAHAFSCLSVKGNVIIASGR